MYSLRCVTKCPSTYSLKLHYAHCNLIIKMTLLYFPSRVSPGRKTLRLMWQEAVKSPGNREANRWNVLSWFYPPFLRHATFCPVSSRLVSTITQLLCRGKYSTLAPPRRTHTYSHTHTNTNTWSEISSEKRGGGGVSSWSWWGQVTFKDMIAKLLN